MNFHVDPLNKFPVFGVHENTGVLFIPSPLPWMDTAERGMD